MTEPSWGELHAAAVAFEQERSQGRPSGWWFEHQGGQVTVPESETTLGDEMRGVIYAAAVYGRPTRLACGPHTAVVVSGAWFDRMIVQGLVADPGEVR